MIDLNQSTNTTYFNLPNEIYIDSLHRGFTEKTAKLHKLAARRFLELTNINEFSEKTTYQDVKPYLLSYLEDCRQRDMGHAAIKAHFSGLSNLFIYLLDEGKIRINPVPSFRARYVRVYKATPPAPKQDLSISDVEYLVNACSCPKLRAILLIFSLTGIRVNELITLNLQDFLKNDGFLILCPDKSKRTNNIIPISAQIRDAIEDYLYMRNDEKRPTDPLFLNEFNTGRIVEKQIRLKIAGLGEITGLHNPAKEAQSFEKLTPHTFRHFFTKMMREQGMGISHVAEMRGDKRSFFAMQDWYYSISYRELKKEYDLYIPIFRLNHIGMRGAAFHTMSKRSLEV